MKKFLTLTISLILTAFPNVAAQVSDRIDAISDNGTFRSFMVDDITSISYSQEGGKGFTSFTVKIYDGTTATLSMYEYPTIRYATVGNEYMEIQRQHEENAVVVMLDCINNDHLIDASKPLDWTAATAGKKVHFDIRGTIGFDFSYEVKGLYTGKVYSDIPGFVFVDAKEDNLLGVNALAFRMPNEPVVIRAIATERTTYEGCDFVGDYQGYAVNPTEELFSNTAEPSLTMSLLANGSNHVSSTDGMKYDFADLYDFNVESNSFKHHIEELDEDEDPNLSFRDQPAYGTNGRFLNDRYVLAEIHDFNDDRLENTRCYLVSKQPFSCTVAQRDASQFQTLIEAVGTDGDKAWFFLTDYGYRGTVASLEFLYGNSISTACEALVSYDGEVRLKYTYNPGSNPVFTLRSSEAGTYSHESGTLPDISLDGFGTATIDGTEYPYSASGSFVTVTLSDGTCYYLLDMQQHTYSVITPNAWEGPASFSNDSVHGAYCDEEANNKNSVSLLLDRNLMGEDREGYASLSVNITRPGGSISAISDCRPYIYDRENRQLWLTNVLVGDGKGGSVRTNLLFQLSDDLQQAWLSSEQHPSQQLAAVSYTGSYVVIDESNPLEAPEVVLPNLEKEYTATLQAGAFGSLTDAEASMHFDTDSEGNAREGYATLHISVMGTTMISACVPYTLSPDGVTLHDVTVGDGNYGTTTTDMVFSIAKDGSLQGNGEYYGCDMSTAFMTVDMASAPFKPVLPGSALAPQYTGKYFLGSNGEDAEVATVDALLCIDHDADGNLTPGKAYFRVRMPAGRFGDKSVEYRLTDNTLTLIDYGVKETDSPDLVFEIRSDGTLQATGYLYGTGSISGFYVNLAKAALTPQQQ